MKKKWFTVTPERYVPEELIGISNKIKELNLGLPNGLAVLLLDFDTDSPALYIVDGWKKVGLYEYSVNDLIERADSIIRMFSLKLQLHTKTDEGKSFVSPQNQLKPFLTPMQELGINN